ncbi:MAG: large ribosomal subunit protein uL16, partial [Planctomycetota bacterium]
MALMPKRWKHRKFQRGKLRGKASRGNRVAFGEYGLQALECGWITAEQIEAGRLAVTHFLRHEGKL